MTTKFSQFTSQGTFAGTDELVGLSGSTNSRWTGAVVADYVASVGVIQSATVTLTAADLAVLDSVPFELVAAPGAGKVMCFSGLYAFATIGAGIMWQQGAPDVEIYTDDFSSPAFPLSIDAVKNGSTSNLVQLLPTPNAGGVASYINTSLFLQASSPLAVPGAIATSSLNDGGAGYADNDTFTVDTGLGTLATGTVTNAVAGVVQPGGYTLDTTPNGYLVATGVATTATSGIGTGLTIDITALDYSANPMTLKVQTLYSVMDV